METYHKIQTLFKRDLDGTRTGKKGQMIEGEWTTDELAYLANNEWEFTEKVDGTNIRVHLQRVEDYLYVTFGGRSDNASIPTPLQWALEGMFNDATARAKVGRWMLKHDIEEAMLFGEGYGPKIQNGGLYRKDVSFVLFDVKIGRWWLTRDAVVNIANELEIDVVPVVGYGTLYDGIETVRWQEQQSCWNPDLIAEGIVARPLVPMFDRKGDRIITKIKAVDFR